MAENNKLSTQVTNSKTSSEKCSDVIIIGGGIIGLMSALELCQQGLEVVLIEKQKGATEASWAGGGIISALYPWKASEKFNALINWSQHAYPRLSKMLYEHTGIDSELAPTGLLYLDDQETNEGYQWCQRQKIKSLMVDHEFNPDISTNIFNKNENRLWIPNVQSVRNPRLLVALREYLSKQSNINLFYESEVFTFLTSNQRILGVNTTKGGLRAKAILIAGGAWSTRLLKQLGLSLPMRPVLGQMIAIQQKAGYLNHTILYKDRYLIPRKDGLILVGSTLENTGFDKITTNTASKELSEVAVNILPSLKDQLIKHHWSGLRPGADQGPWIGQVPNVHGLYINTGHYRNGLASAPASGRLISDIIMKNAFESLRISVVNESDYSPLCLIDKSQTKETETLH